MDMLSIYLIITRAGVYETLCPEHMLAPKGNLEKTEYVQKLIR